jgi:hypothetical protein
MRFAVAALAIRVEINTPLLVVFAAMRFTLCMSALPVLGLVGIAVALATSH